MIELSANTALMLYLLLTLTTLLIFWIYHLIRIKRKTILPAEKELTVCEYCHSPYLQEATKGVSQCPKCHSFNKKP